jgi:hypothetical protein
VWIAKENRKSHESDTEFPAVAGSPVIVPDFPHHVVQAGVVSDFQLCPAGKLMQRNPPQHKGPSKNGALALPEHFGMYLAAQKRKPFPTWSM